MSRNFNEKINVVEKITLWWKFEGRYYHKDFINGIKNLCKWFPVIWKDRDWDNHYTFDILKFKIKKQANYIEKQNRYVGCERDVEIMRLVVKLIELNQDEFYDMEYMDYHKTEYEFVPTDETEKWFTMEDELISENFDEYFKKYPRQYKRVMSGEINRFRREPEEKDKKLIAMEIAHENQERCHRLLFNLLSNNIRKWWD